MILKENYLLSNGISIPKLGLGTWMVANEAVSQLVLDAIEVGYRHLDTAQAYGNESGLGVGIKKANVKREELFITTKLAAEIKDYQGAVSAIDGSLAALGLDYIDLMLIHSPQPWMEFGEEDRFFEGNLEAWRALEDAYKAGKLRAIGVSNFKQEDLENILNNCSIKPMVNQLLVHASNTPFDLIKYCEDADILVEAYSPIAHGEAMKNPLLHEIANKYNVSVPQLCIRYDLQLGTLPLPKTANPDHMRSNADIDFVISDEDMLQLKEMEQIKDYGASSFFPVYGGKLK